MAKKKKGPGRKSHLQIETYGGNSIMPRDSWVWILAGDKAVHKKVEHVAPGDLVLFKAPKIRVSLNEIKGALLESDLAYKFAHQQLHITQRGIELPKLQHYLESVVDKSDLNEAAKEIVGLLSRVESRATGIAPEKDWRASRHIASIKSWLAGETVLPEHPQALRVLRRLNSEKFDELFSSPRELKASGGVLYGAHETWSGIHTTLRRWIAPLSEKALAFSKEEFEVPTEEEYRKKDEETAKSDAEKKSFAEQRTLIYKKLIAPIYQSVGGPESQLAFVRVRKINPIEKTGKAEPKREAPTLDRGVVLERSVDPKSIGIETIKHGDIFKEGWILGRIIANLLDDIPLATDKGFQTGFGALIGKMIYSTDELEPEMRYSFQVSGKYGITGVTAKGKDVINATSGLRTDIQDGRLDKKHGLARGTLLKLLERTRLVEQQFPIKREKSELMTLFGKRRGLKNRKEVTENAHEIDKLLRVHNAYGLPALGLHLPSLAGVKTEGEYRRFVEGLNEAHRKNGGREPVIYPLPPSKREVIKTLLNAGVEGQALRSLVKIYGHENFLRRE